MKVWDINSYYDVLQEFNRIEKYNEYCKKWFAYYNIVVDFTSKTDWGIEDIPDILDFNRIKQNINKLLEVIESSSNRLAISTQVNQNLTIYKVNEIEQRLQETLNVLGEWQFSYQTTGLAITGDNLKLGGVN